MFVTSLGPLAKVKLTQENAARRDSFKVYHEVIQAEEVQTEDVDCVCTHVLEKERCFEAKGMALLPPHSKS